MSYTLTNPPDDGLLVSSEIRENFQAFEGAILGQNLCKDPTFLIWAAGDALAPTHWVSSGTSHAIARAGTGLADTKRKVGAFCSKLTAGGGATAYLMQSLLSTTSYDDFLDGLTISMGAWVWCSAAGTARLIFDDGAGTTSSTAHTGGSSWEWLTVTRTISTSATKVEFGMSVGAGGVGYLSGPTVAFGDVPPSRYQPSPCVVGTLKYGIKGSLAALTGTQKDTWQPGRPAIIRYVQLYAKTAPTGASIIADVNTWDGSAFTSMFSTRPTIAISANSGGAAPDGTYARRCLGAFVNTTGYPTSAGQFLDWDLDQVGSSVTGSDFAIHIRALQYTSPLEAFLGPTDI